MEKSKNKDSKDFHLTDKVKGLSDDDVPDLWQKNFSDEIELWIELGQPSEQRIKKGCNQSQQMMNLDLNLD